MSPQSEVLRGMQGTDHLWVYCLTVAREFDDGGYQRRNWRYPSGGCASGQEKDHVVALKEAYQPGGHRWSTARKTLFAHDTSN